MFEVIAFTLIGLVGGILVYAATRPDSFRIQRSANIKAPPERIFAILNDFQQWAVWSPWEKKDPGMKRTFGSTTVGTGATYAWEGNKDVGQGSMAIVESSAPAKLAIRLDFIKPFEAHNIVEFTLEPIGDGTQVTWSMHGPSPYFSKLMSVFVSMDKMCGKDFEAGLASLKAVAEQ